MRAVFLTHYYPPEVGAPQTRLAALVRGLRKRGIDAVVHAPPPHYPTGRIAAPYRNRLLHRERLDDVTVVRSAVLPAPNRGFAARLANHVSFAGTALLTARATGRADAVVVESPPLFTAAGGVLYARLKRAPVVVHVADRWPASAVELGALRNPVAVGAAERLERWIYRHAALITVPTQGLEHALRAEPATGGRVARVPPAVDLDRFDAVPARRTVDEPLRVVYAGTVGMSQGVTTLVEAAALAGPATVAVKIAGAGAESDAVARRRREVAAGNVELLGLVPATEIPALYAAADVGVVLLHDRPIFHCALPTKLLEVMAAGRAVVLAARGEAAELVRRAQCGIVVTPGDAGALAAALRDLAADPERARSLGAAGRRAAEPFSRAGAIARWADLLAGVAGGTRRPAGRAAAPRSAPRVART